jgi:hypothetical protein
LDLIEETISEFERSEEEDDEEPKKWTRPGGSMSERAEEEEIKRLFDGLRDIRN